MSNKVDDGGAAYPVLPPLDNAGLSSSGYPYPEPGMTLRDWFAGQALAGITAGLCAGSAVGDRAYDRVSFTHSAVDAYTIADAMIAERKASQP